MKIEINKQNMLKVLKDTFSKNTNLFTELLQNSRRAGATEINVTTSADNNTVTFVDNGSGIKDFQKLFTLAESGYDQDVIDEEHPFGLGFLSTLFRAESITITSNNKRITFNTAYVLEGNAIDEPEVLNTTTEGTSIFLQFDKSIAGIVPTRQLNELLSKFPVDVVVNGVEFPAYAPKDEYMVETSMGTIDTTDLQGKGEIHLRPNILMYYQYLPILENRSGSATYWASLRRCNGTSVRIASLSLHLPNTTRVRMPERDYLLDSTSIRHKIHCVWEVVHEVMVKDKDEFSYLEFTEKWFNTINSPLYSNHPAYEAQQKCMALFNDVPYVTGKILTKPDSTLPLAEYDNVVGGFLPVNEIFHKSVLKDTVLIDNKAVYEDTLSNLHLVVVTAMKGLLVDTDKVHKNHWINKLVNKINKDSFDAVTWEKSTKKEQFYGCYYIMNVHVTDKVTFNYKGKEIDISGYTIVLPSHLVIPSENEDLSEIVLFLDACQDEYDSYQESIHDQLCKDLGDCINRLSSKSITEYKMNKIIKYAMSLKIQDLCYEIADNNLTFIFPEEEEKQNDLEQEQNHRC